MHTALIVLASSTVILLVITGVFRIEDARGGRRVLCSGLRHWFDNVLEKASTKLLQLDTYIGRGVARLMLHYAAHGILQRLLSWIGRIEKKVEHLLRRNKQVAKEIRTNRKKTHLDVLQEHQDKTALTEAQKRKLRSHE